MQKKHPQSTHTLSRVIPIAYANCFIEQTPYNFILNTYCPVEA